VGVNFKDIEKVLQDIVSSKKFSSKEQQIEAELLAEIPEKIHGLVKPTMADSPPKLEYLLDEEEVFNLILASRAPYVEPDSPIKDMSYATYTVREVDSLVAGNYEPTRFRKRK
jgi:hypothetical protein